MRRFKWFERSLTVVGVAVAVMLVMWAGAGLPARVDVGFAVLLAFIALGELAPVAWRPSFTVAETTTGGIFAFVMLLEYGTTAAAVSMAVASLISDLAQGKAPFRVRSNAAQWVLSLALAGVALHAALGTPLGTPVSFERSEAPAIAFAALICCGTNYLLVCALVALHAGRSVSDLVRVNFWPAAGEEIAALGLGAAIAFAGIRLSTLPLLVLPFALTLGARQTAKRAERGLRDPLTELPNRLVFLDRAQQAIGRSARDGIGGAVLVVDLDGFKEINDTFGHQAGDALLREVAARVSAQVRSTDTVARLGGDEFGVLLVGVDDFDGVTRVIRAIRHALDQPAVVGSSACRVGGSIGVATFTGGEHDVDALLHRADLAMYDDKRRRAATGRPALV